MKWKLSLILVLMSSAVSAVAFASPFTQASYSAVMTFTDHNPSTTMTIAWDGTNYYTASGGGPGSPYGKYDANGGFISAASPTPGIDFRSVFTDSANSLLARGYNSSSIYQQTSFGNFMVIASLAGGLLDSQSAVVLNGAKTEYLAQSGGTVSRWDLAGNYLGAVTLSGFGGGEAFYPQGRGLATAGNNLLTYYDGILTAWSMAGVELGSTALTGAGTGFDSGFSYSYANDLFWVVDEAGGTWRGYDIGLGQSAPIPEPSTFLLLGAGLAGVGLLRRRSKNQCAG